jgi:malonate decarboxylase gamma subunit
MRIPAMARVTKLPEAMLTELSQSNPVFAPGVGNYVAMGGVRALWQGRLAGLLARRSPTRRWRTGVPRTARAAAVAVWPRRWCSGCSTRLRVDAPAKDVDSSWAGGVR